MPNRRFQRAIAPLLLLAAACTAGSPPRPDSGAAAGIVADSVARHDTTVATLRLTAEARVARDSLVVALVARNTGDSTVHVTWGGCPLDPRLYRSADRQGEPAYDWMKQPNSDPAAGGRVCPMFLANTPVAPGDSLSPPAFRVAVPVDTVIAIAGGAGRYYVTLGARLGWTAPGSAPVDSLRLDVGAIELRK